MTIGRILDEKLMVGVVTEIECSICKKTYFPVDSDISLMVINTLRIVKNAVSIV